MRREPGPGPILASARKVGGLPIVARGVSLSRGAATILHDIDLTISRGGPTFILGANGSGKSTLLRILHGLIAPTEGSITWNGASTRPSDQSMVFQRPVLLRRSAEGNVRYALSLAGVKDASADRRIRKALADVGLSDVAKRPARVLSGGEQQRLALARAWALDPDVLFLDEPTASLDPAATRAVEQIVSDIHSRGTTIVMTTHNLAQAKRLADDIVFLQSGRIAERSGADQFFRSPQSAEASAFLEGERL